MFFMVLVMKDLKFFKIHWYIGKPGIANAITIRYVGFGPCCDGYAFRVQIIFQGLKWEVVGLEGSLDRMIILPTWAWEWVVFCIIGADY